MSLKMEEQHFRKIMEPKGHFLGHCFHVLFFDETCRNFFDRKHQETQTTRNTWMFPHFLSIKDLNCIIYIYCKKCVSCYLGFQAAVHILRWLDCSANYLEVPQNFSNAADRSRQIVSKLYNTKNIAQLTRQFSYPPTW